MAESLAGLKGGGNALKVPSAKPKAPRNIGPLKGGIGSLPMSKAVAPMPKTTPRPAPRLFTSFKPPTNSLATVPRQIAEAAKPSRQQRHYEQVNTNAQEKRIGAGIQRQLMLMGPQQRLDYIKNLSTQSRGDLATVEPGRAPKEGFLQRALKFLNPLEDVPKLERGTAEDIGLLRHVPGMGGRTLFNPTGNPFQAKEEAQRAAKVAVQGGSLVAPFAAARGLTALEGAARGADIGSIARGVGEREALDQVARNALKARDLVGPSVLGKAPETEAQLKNLEQISGAVARRPASRAFKLGASTAGAYGKLAVTAAPAKAALELEPKQHPHESFPLKFWHDAAHTVANLPASVIEGVKHPLKTAEGMLNVYAHPEQAFKENSFGTLLAFLAPAGALERGLGGAFRKGSKGKLFSQERPDISYRAGETQSRNWQPGVVSQTAQRIAGLAADKRSPIIRREGPLRPGERLGSVQEATRWQERRDILGSRAGGFVRPGQIDEIQSGRRLAHNLYTMSAHDFLGKRIPGDKPHQTALMLFHQGEARNADTFWKDAKHRKEELESIRYQLTGNSANHNKQQIDRLNEMFDHEHQISSKDLQHYERAAGEVAIRQREDWMRGVQQGLGHAGQLNARNALAVAIHGYRMGRGELQYRVNQGPHPLKAAIGEARKVQKEAWRELEKAKLASKAAGNEAKGIKAGQDYRLERAEYGHQLAMQNRDKAEKAYETAKFSGAITPKGDMQNGWYDGNGAYITPKEIEAFIKEHFGREIGFLTHKEDLVKAQSMNTYDPRSVYNMRTVTKGPQGAYDNTPAALRNHFDRMAHNLSTMEGRRGVAEHLALLGRDGKPMTEAEALALTENLNTEKGGATIPNHLGPWVPYRLGSEKVASLLSGRAYPTYLKQHAIVEHALIEGGKDGAKVWGVMPKQVADRLTKWDTLEQTVANSGWRKATSPWRQTVLYTSTHWPMGTTIENSIRLAFHQVSPLVVLPYGKYSSISFGTGSHIRDFLDAKINDPLVPHAQKQAALQHRAMLGTGNFVGAQLHELEPALHQLNPDSLWGKLANGGYGVGRLNTGLIRTERGFGPISPGNHLGWRPYRHAIGNMLNRMETNAKIAADGKLALNDSSFLNGVRKINREQAAHDYVEKITTDPRFAIKSAQDLLEVMGNWTHLTPGTRSAQAQWAPFALWWLNSAKFVFKTLPRDHPYATGLLAAMITATGQENRNLKGFLEGTVPLTLPFIGAIDLNPVHYSPFDIASEPVAKAGSMILPQAVEPIETSQGLTSLTGEKFEGEKPGEGNEFTAAGRLGRLFVESYLPGTRLVSSMLREGGKPTKTGILPWETRKGTQTGIFKALMKEAIPFKFTYAKKKPKPEPVGHERGVGVERGGLGRERSAPGRERGSLGVER